MKQADGWVADGTFKAARMEIWSRADTIVILEPPPLQRMWRVLQREWQRERSTRRSISGMLWLLLQASGLGPQRKLTEQLKQLQTNTAESARKAEIKRERQRAKGQTTKAGSVRERVPMLVLRGDAQVQEWLASLAGGE